MDYRALLKNVESTLSAVERTEDVTSTIVGVGEAVVRNFRNELGILGGRFYVRRESSYELERGFGRSRKVPAGISVPADYGPIRRAEEEGLARIGLRLEFEGTLEGFARMAGAVEAERPLLFLDNVTIRPSGAPGPGGAPSSLSMRMDVFGFGAKEPGS